MGLKWSPVGLKWGGGIGESSKKGYKKDKMYVKEYIRIYINVYIFIYIIYIISYSHFIHTAHVVH